MLNKKHGFFITGTDTGVGKTVVTAGLLKHFKNQGYSTAALKPLATGGINTPDGWRNEDVMAIHAECSLPLTDQEINPFSFVPAIAPEIAAKEVGVTLTVEKTTQACEPIFNKNADITIVEGVGGWMVPISEDETMADFALSLKLPVIVVIGMRLGCINHALLTRAAVLERKLLIAGWVANCIEPNMPYLKENIETLKKQFEEPLLGVVPFMSEPDMATVAKSLSLSLPSQPLK